MDDLLGRQILNALHYNQAAAKQILDRVTNPGGAPRAADTPNGGARSSLPHIFDGIPGAQAWGGFNYADLAQSAQNILNAMFQRPDGALESINKFWTEQFRVLTGTSDIAPAKGDHRFDDPEWRDNPYYKLAMQNHLLLRQGLDQWVDQLPVEHKEAERIRFAISLVTEALAPSNWPTNPAALKHYFETGGQSAVRGLQHMVEDAVGNAGMPSVAKHDALKVGRDMATTPGKVVHRTQVFELIQYAPSTKRVHARPFLMVPPQINRFYFYDLSEKKSLIRYAVDAGLATFVISWRNPGPEHRDWNFDTYITAIEEAIDVICAITGSRDVNIEGGCIAGLEVAALLGDLAQRGERKVHSATLMVTMLDTSVETQLGVLATPETLVLARANSMMKGLMEGQEMGRVFAFLRPNDLVWNYWVNNYLMGNDPPTFDVLAWNADTSRMTAGFHLDLLDVVQNNSLASGKFKVRGKPVRLDKVKCDQFWLAGLADHITPWRACYASSRLLGGKREFVVSDGGHIQSMISSPSNPKAKYFVNPRLPATPDAWLKGASEHEASWWLIWRDWIKARSGNLTKAPTMLGSRAHRPLGDAPGTYVFE
jgi:poly[(R)-3-hydroxyalkanoate] polymerase subunit PhaC